jgi:hypothetical protein
MDTLRELDSVDAVLKELGGLTKAGELVGATAQTINHYKLTKRFPPKTYLVFTEALRAKGFTAPASLWGMVEPIPAEPGIASPPSVASAKSVTA